jgi:hypothetical protein
LKKRSKKLLLNGEFGKSDATLPGTKSFFGSPGGQPFFSKKELFTFFLPAIPPACCLASAHSACNL